MSDNPSETHAMNDNNPEAQLREKQWQTFDNWMGETLKEQRRARRWKIFFRFAFFSFLMLSLGNTVYFLHFASNSDEDENKQHVALVDVKGVIDASEEATASRINSGLRSALEADNVAAVILRINSPGGSPVQSQAVYEEIRYLTSEYPDTPILSWVEDVGASGAYYIAAATENIYAAPASLVGSIGVISSGFGFSEAIERVGVERRTFTAGENKAFLDPFNDVTVEQRTFWESVLGNTHSQFIQAVRDGRGERLNDSEEVFSGLIWTGEQALELGLIDGVMTLEQLSRELIGNVEFKNYTPRLSPLELLSRRMGPSIASWLGLDAHNGIRYQLPSM
tara:strand:+ start:1946 stop:2956 length:1011 start_codon:yes stop_codon:yes gene_type:complete